MLTALVAVASFGIILHEDSQLSAEADPPYTVTFDPNGGVCEVDGEQADYSITTQTGKVYVPGAVFTYRDGEVSHNVSFTKKGNSLAGWKDPDGNFIGSSNLTAFTDNTVLKAEWIPNTYNVTLVFMGERTLSIDFGDSFDTTQIFSEADLLSNEGSGNVTYEIIDGKIIIKATPDGRGTLQSIKVNGVDVTGDTSKSGDSYIYDAGDGEEPLCIEVRFSSNVDSSYLIVLATIVFGAMAVVAAFLVRRK